jgi:hypothetical protein
MADALSADDRRALHEVGLLPRHTLAERIGRALGLPTELAQGKIRALAWRGLIEYRDGAPRLSAAGLAAMTEDGRGTDQKGNRT